MILNWASGLFGLTQTSHYDLAQLRKCLRVPPARANCKLRSKKFVLGEKKVLKPSEIAVLYRAETEGWVKRLASLIFQQTAVLAT